MRIHQAAASISPLIPSSSDHEAHRTDLHDLEPGGKSRQQRQAFCRAYVSRRLVLVHLSQRRHPAGCKRQSHCLQVKGTNLQMQSRSSVPSSHLEGMVNCGYARQSFNLHSAALPKLQLASIR